MKAIPAVILALLLGQEKAVPSSRTPKPSPFLDHFLKEPGK